MKKQIDPSTPIPSKVSIGEGKYKTEFNCYISGIGKPKPLFTKEQGEQVCKWLNESDEEHGEYDNKRDCFIFTSADYQNEEIGSQLVLTSEGVKTLYAIGSQVFPWEWRRAASDTGL